MASVEVVANTSQVVAIDHLELYVANIVQAQHFYRSVLGFEVVELASGEMLDDQCSICLQRQGITLVLTAPLTSTGSVADYISVHGEGVRDVALAVRGIEDIFERATKAGGKAILRPCTRNVFGSVARVAQVGSFGDVVHTLIERNRSRDLGPLDSGDRRGGAHADQAALDAVDHIAVAVTASELEHCVRFYVHGLGLCETHQQDVSTEYSAMTSKVVQSPNGCVRFPIMAPAQGKRKSQIQHFLDAHRGPGVQHLAFRSPDIITSVSMLAAEGLEFLPTPSAYYNELESRVGKVEGIGTLQRFGILADRDASGLLLQVFSKPIGTRPTLFLEIVERRGAQGFGAGNIKALFEAVERTHVAGGNI